uniref:Uncharacterized protein n=1 Tax=Leersia perrieri TaxID=77586 RepID=A0A0D9VNZ3_9ORYZ
MLLNPVRFMWNYGDIYDRGMYRDSFFFITTLVGFSDMVLEADAADEEWRGYGVDLDAKLKEYKATFKKNLKHNRRELDAKNVPVDQYEVKGRVKARRRTLLPADFEQRAGFPRPHEELMVIEYRRRQDQLEMI